MGILTIIILVTLSVAASGIALGITTVLPSLVSVLGSTIVAWAVFGAGRTQDRIKTTLDLHKDYYSPLFALSRNMAEHFYQFHHANDWSTENPYDLEDPEDKLKGYSEVLRYFHRLSILWQRDRLDDDLLTDLFSREMGYWMGFIFEPMGARTDWWTKSDIYRLAGHLAKSHDENYDQGRREGVERRVEGPIRVRQVDGTVVKTMRGATPPMGSTGAPVDRAAKPTIARRFATLITPFLKGRAE